MQTSNTTKFQSLIGRLKTVDFGLRVGLHLQFQSLIGRLKTRHRRDNRHRVRRFQSLIGRLKTIDGLLVPRLIARFNPS